MDFEGRVIVLIIGLIWSVRERYDINFLVVEGGYILSRLSELVRKWKIVG